MKILSTCQEIVIAAPRKEVFSIAAGLPAAKFINAYGPIPGIISTKGSVCWQQTGDTREHTLSDKSSVNEELVSFAEDEFYAYRVTGFSGIFGQLVSEARGEWVFEWRGPHETLLTWTYSFTPKGSFARLITSLIVKYGWQGYLRHALTNLKDIIEKSP